MKTWFGAILMSAAAMITACGGSEPSLTSPSGDNASRAAAVASAGGRVAGEAELTGLVQALPPSTAASTFTVAGKTVITNASTAFANGSFASLTVGTSVEVKGTLAGDTITATRVEIVRAPAPAPPAAEPEPEPEPEPGDNRGPGNGDEARAEGTLGAVSGTCPAIASSIGSTRFTTSASTRFDDVACSAFRTGNRVEVRGTRASDGSIAASRLEMKK